MEEDQSVCNQIHISEDDMQLFNRLKKIIDAAVKMECAGCHKLVPTTQFYDHLIDSFDNDQCYEFINHDVDQEDLSAVLDDNNQNLESSNLILPAFPS